jgi:hypothetical protein
MLIPSYLFFCGHIKDAVDGDASPATFPELVERVWSAAIGTPAMLMQVWTELEYYYMCWSA